MGLEHLRPFLVRVPVPHLARFFLRSNLLKNRLSLFSTHMPHTHRLYYNKGIHTRLVHRGPSSRERRDGRWIRNRSALQHHRCKRLPGPQQVYQHFRWGAQAYPPPSSGTQFCRWRFLVWCRDGCVCVFFFSRVFPSRVSLFYMWWLFIERGKCLFVCCSFRYPESF